MGRVGRRRPSAMGTSANAAGLAWRPSGGQAFDEPNAVLSIAVVPGRYWDVAGLCVAWLDVEAHPLVNLTEPRFTDAVIARTS